VLLRSDLARQVVEQLLQLFDRVPLLVNFDDLRSLVVEHGQPLQPLGQQFELLVCAELVEAINADLNRLDVVARVLKRPRRPACLNTSRKRTPKRPDAARERDAATCHNAPGKGASWPATLRRMKRGVSHQTSPSYRTGSEGS
jgi:hypothetical protein